MNTKLISIIVAVLFCTSNTNAQRYFTKLVSQNNFGSPYSLAQGKSVFDNLGNQYHIGSIYNTSQKHNLLVSKFDPNGNLLWQTQIDHNGQDDYGANIWLNSGGGVYVCGAGYHSLVQQNNIMLAAITVDGIVDWQTSYNSGDDVPLLMQTDNSGNIVVVGTSIFAMSKADVVTLQFDNTGNLNWSKTYNYLDFNEAPFMISIDANDNIDVLGFSQPSISSWDYLNLSYSSSGTLNSTARTATNGKMETPNAVVEDGNGNFIFVGYSRQNNGNKLLSLVKLNASFVVQWNDSIKLDTLNSEAMDVTLDNSNNIYLTGYSESRNGYTRSLTAKYNPSGAQQWIKQYGEYSSGMVTVGEKIVFDGGMINLGGNSTQNNNSKLFFGQYDTDGGYQWMREHDAQTSGTYHVSQIAFDPNDLFVVNGNLDASTGSSYTSLMIDLFYVSQADTTDSLAAFRYVNNRIVIRLDTPSVINSTVDNLDVEFGELQDFLTPAAITKLNNALSDGQLDLNGVTVTKVHPDFTTNITTSISRQGDVVDVEPYWTCLIFHFPNEVNEKAYTDLLNEADNVMYAQRDGVFTAYVGSNDTHFNTKQKSLQKIAGNDSAHINITPAWDINTGSKAIKVGIYDMGLWPGHEDLGASLVLKQGQSNSNKIVKGGYDFTTTSELGKNGNWDFRNPGNFQNYANLVGHGTAVAGIIGAARNNNLGIAGIAGGSGANGGVELYGMRIFNDNGTSGPNSIVKDAIIKGALNSGTYGYALNAMNHSWGTEASGNIVYPYFTGTQSRDINDLFNAIQTAAKNGVVQVAARGNTGLNTQWSFPADFADTYCINVGGSDKTGTRWSLSSYGGTIDFMAPADSAIVYTTGIANASDYTDFGGTSSAAPHVTGVACLIMSEANGGGNHPTLKFPIYPNDVEEILKRTAKDKHSAGYDEFSGWGLIDAGKALEQVDYPTYRFEHYDGKNLPTPTMVKVDSNVYVHLTQTMNGMPKLEANVDVYELTYNVTHSTRFTGDVLKGAWARGAMSMGMDTVRINNGYRFPGNNNFWVASSTTTGAVLKTYAVFVKKSIHNQSFNKWLPADPSAMVLPYTLHLYNENYTSTEEVVDKIPGIKVYPNPTHSQVIVNIELEKANYQITSVMGAVIKKGKLVKGNNTLDINNQADGLYILTVTSENKKFSYRIVKE